MADAGALNCLQEWNSVFKKSLGKLSCKCYRSFLLDIAAIVLGFKPSLLFDYAVVDWKNASSLMKGLAAKGLVSQPLDVLKVGEDIFFTDLNLLVNKLRKSVDSEEFTLIDVSGNFQEPRVLENKIADCVKRQCQMVVEILERKLKDSSLNVTQRDGIFSDLQLLNLSSCSDENWCVPTIFGFLLGYPVIYWCDQASDLNCLSMVPLNRYTVTFKASLSVLHSLVSQSCHSLVAAGCDKAKSRDHTLFSFTAPVALECHYESRVSEWVKRIGDMGQIFGIAEHLTVQKTTVTFAQITL